MLALLKTNGLVRSCKLNYLLATHLEEHQLYQIAVFPEADLGTKASIQLPRSGLLLQKIGDPHVFHVDTI